MLEEYLGHIGQHAAFLELASLNSPTTTTDDLEGEVSSDLVEMLPCLAPDPEVLCVRLDTLNKVGAFVDTLPNHLKATAILHYWDGLTQQQVAVSLGISQSAVSQRLSKVVSMGRKFFDLDA